MSLLGFPQIHLEPSPLLLGLVRIGRSLRGLPPSSPEHVGGQVTILALHGIPAQLNSVNHEDLDERAAAQLVFDGVEEFGDDPTR